MVSRVAVLGIFAIASLAPAVAQRKSLDQPDMLVNQRRAEQGFLQTTLSGNVRVQGATTSDLRIEVRDISSGAIAANGFLDRQGNFNINGLRPGEYEIVATSGLDEVRERVRIGYGSNTTMVNLVLVKSADTTGAGDQHSVSVAEMQTPNKARKSLIKAQKLADSGDHEASRKELEKILAEYPQFAEGLTLRAVLAMNAGDYVAAVKDLDAAIKVNPQFATAYTALGAAYNGTDRFNDALRVLDRAASLAPNSWQVPFEMARALIGKGDFAGGLKQANRAASLVTKQFPELTMLKAHALIGMRDYDGAIAVYESVLSTNPSGEIASIVRTELESVRAFAEREE